MKNKKKGEINKEAVKLYKKLNIKIQDQDTKKYLTKKFRKKQPTWIVSSNTTQFTNNK
jgi:hypothetical protein